MTDVRISEAQAAFLRDNAAIVRLHIERFRRIDASAGSDILDAAVDVADLAEDYVTRVLTALTTPAPDPDDLHDCDECGRQVPAEPISGLHAESCSLHPASIVARPPRSAWGQAIAFPDGRDHGEPYPAGDPAS
jgi:hypothetical protein